MTLHEKILYYRKQARLSQEELAARVGVSRQAVSKWELGDATPEVDKLVALARVFGVTTDELLSPEEPAAGTPPPPPPGRSRLTTSGALEAWPGSSAGTAGWRGCTSPSAGRGSPWWADWPGTLFIRCSSLP